MDIKSIVYKRNNENLIINIDNENTLSYNGFSTTIDTELLLKYLEYLFNIIASWKNEYTDITIIDGDNWQLSIVYINGNKKEYYGKASFPTNFESFERLNKKLIDEVF